MNYQIEFKNFNEFKRATKKLQALTGLPLSWETKSQLDNGLLPNKKYCVAIYESIYEILTLCTQSYGVCTTLKLPKVIKYNRTHHLTH